MHLRESTIAEYMRPDEISLLKERMYCVDVHIWIHTIELLTTYSGLREVY
jgi:hypothetical protein